MNQVLSRRAAFVAVLVVIALAAAACGNASTSTTAGEGQTDITPAPNQAESGTNDPGTAATNSVSSGVGETPAPPQTPSAETNNDVSVANYPSFVGSTSQGASFDMASLAGEDVILWFWAPW